ncbi:MAG: nucleotidyltransferase family protein [Thermotogaceae bacterium]|nr:nucleotidyltransferase family protein [Thermotogaceae bacterium]
MNSESVALILLAAGESSRFRGEKLLTDFRGKPLLQWSLDNLESVVALKKILVLKPDFEIKKLRTGTFRTVVNENYSDGISTSIVRGMEECPKSCEGIVLSLADMPLITGEDVKCLLDSVRPDDEMVSFVFRGEKGFPTFISKKLFPELSRISGDKGAYQLVKRNLASIREIEGGRHNVFDIDVPGKIVHSDHDYSF